VNLEFATFIAYYKLSFVSLDCFAGWLFYFLTKNKKASFLTITNRNNEITTSFVWGFVRLGQNPKQKTKLKNTIVYLFHKERSLHLELKLHYKPEHLKSFLQLSVAFSII